MSQQHSVTFQIKRLLQHSAVYGIGHIVSRSLGFLLLPFYTNVFMTDEYGQIALIFTFLAIMNVIYGYGMDIAFLRYVALQDDTGKQRILFSTGFVSLLLTSTVFSIVLILFHNSVAGLLFHSILSGDYILLCAGILFFDIMALMPFMVLRAKEKAVPFTLLKLAGVVLNISGNIVFIVILDMGIAGIFWANLISSALTFLILFPIILRQFIFKFDKSIFKDLVSFGLPYVPTGLAVVAMDLIDRFFLERMTNLEITGIYSAGYKLGMFMALFVAAFRFAWHPFFLSTSKQENARQVFAKILTYFVLACSTVFLMISFFIDEIVRVEIFGFTIYGEAYWPGTAIVPFILISYIFYGVYVNFLVGVYLKKKTAMLPFITGAAAAVNIIGNLVLIPLLGMMGSAVAKVLCFFTMAALLFYKTRRLYPVRYEWGRVIRISIVAIGLFILQEYIFQFESLLLKLGLIFSFVLILIATGFLDESEKNRLNSLFKRVIKNGG